MRISDYELNRLRLLKTIRRTERVTRTELVTLTGLAGASITQLTGDLVRRGIVLEEKAAGRALGRPRMYLKINPAAAYVISVSFSLPNGVTAEIANLKGEVVFVTESRLQQPATLRSWIVQVTRFIDTAIKSGPVARRAIARVAVPIPGVVDNRRGVVHWMATYPERDIPAAAMMEKKLGIAVSIDNNTNLLARAEHWFGDEHLDDFSLLMVDQSVTSAHYVDGSLWAGSHGINPEIAHTKFGFGDEQPCYCGMKGCLATYCAEFGIVARVARLRGEAVPDHRKQPQTYRRFAAEARAGEPCAASVFAQAGHLLGVRVGNLINERDPGKVVVIASDAELIALTSRPLFKALEATALPVLRERTQVEFRLLNPAHPRKGAAALALEEIYTKGWSRPAGHTKLLQSSAHGRAAPAAARPDSQVARLPRSTPVPRKGARRQAR